MADRLLYRHDDGRWLEAEILDQYRERTSGQWRVLVRYSAGVGQNYLRAEWADDERLRPLP